ncbi:hypothetical protein R4K54_07900 [Brachyspira murdochii]|uniref:Uncharacterized protein n=1 Tax=Brachyspira murdochii (strain ATCC 51284 / DSM 12563 / 56-150) TaxID=526224 RepID=D5U417_BRAM5|nr:hypothetical protein [Brachyspira murdochii]ADG72198.1 conserved hypothetical protein [Brachyspira murdochii DSM 12563]
MNNKNIKLITDKLDELIKYLENNNLDEFFKNKNEFCSMIMNENSKDFNDDIKGDIKIIVPENLIESFKNFIKYLSVLRAMKSDDNDYTQYTLDNIKYIRKEIFKDY